MAEFSFFCSGTPSPYMTATLAHQMTRDVPPFGDPGSWICSQMGEGGFSIQAQNPPAALWLVPNETSRGQVSTLRAAILPRLSAVRPPGRQQPESPPATHATLEPKPCFVSACHRSPITTVARDSGDKTVSTEDGQPIHLHTDMLCSAIPGLFLGTA